MVFGIQIAMVRLRFKKSKPLNKKDLLLSKIMIAFALILAGIIIIYIGSTNFQKEPYLIKDINFPAEFEENGKIFLVDLKFKAQDGLVPYRGIEPYFTITFPEVTTNSSNVELLLLDGRIINPNDNPAIAREGKPVKFEFDTNTTEGSRYIATPYLVYYSAGTHSAILSIKLEDNQVIKHEFGNVIELDSWERYFAERSRNDSTGISWLLIGIALITVTPAFTKILDWGYDYQQLKSSKNHNSERPK